MFIDPEWPDGGTLADASKVASGGTEINGRIAVGQNALLVLGDTSTTAAEAAFADSQLKWDPQGYHRCAGNPGTTDAHGKPGRFAR